MWLHEKFYDAEKLLKYNPNWVLYTITDRYAYFTLLPKPIAEYNVRNAPFLSLEQFSDALKLARMPIKDFCTFACHSLGPMKGKATISSYKMMDAAIFWKEAVYLQSNFPKLGKWLFGYELEKSTVEKVKPESLLERAFVIFAAPYSWFLKNRHCYALPEVTYENLISKPEETIGAVFDVCGISRSLIPEAVTALNRDSQAGTVLSRDKMAQVKSLELSRLDRKRLNEIAKRMELPESIFHF
ncbi:unnamed protein product [Rotaria sordida]|uniref:Sulfotransferase n=2 Tax=Rotaria sordida TaxID=392033 RepID=A0A815LJF6_9BILA|nr:unnamed protein product [Rotaria sordida]